MFQRVYFFDTQMYDYALNASISILSDLVNCNLKISVSSSQAPYSLLPVAVSTPPAYAQPFAPPSLPEPVLSLELAALEILVWVRPGLWSVVWVVLEALHRASAPAKKPVR